MSTRYALPSVLTVSLAPYEAPAQRQWVAQHRAYWEHFTVTAGEHTTFVQYGFASPLAVCQTASGPAGASTPPGAPQCAIGVQRTSSCDVVVPVAFFASRSGPPLSHGPYHLHYPAISPMVAETCHAFALPMLPDGSGGHCGALSLLEDDGEKAQRPVIPIRPRNDTYSRDHHRYSGTIVGHAVKEIPCTCHPLNKKLPLATSSWPSWGWC